jgi:quercetin dioxygenase-like cupin family protein
MIRKIVISVLMLCALAWSQATEKPARSKAKAAGASESATTKTAVFNPEDLKWGPAPAFLPPGAQLAVLEGDPTRPGPFTMRLKMPDGYKIQPHWHPSPEHVTVLSGTLKVGMGAKFDESNPKVLSTGSFGVIEPRMKHFAWANGETIIQLHGIGPWRLVYVNPNDNPVKPKPSTTGQ